MGMKFFHVKKFTIIFQVDKGWQIAYENVEGLCCGLSYLLLALLSISQLRSIIFLSYPSTVYFKFLKHL